MIDSFPLLKDLKRQLKLLREDLRQQVDDGENAWGARLQEQHRAARERGRTSQPWLEWREGQIDQAAVAWIIATTFIRFCEDNHLLDGARDEEGRPVPTLWIAGPAGRTARALENQTQYFREHRDHNRRDWLHQAFRILAAQPAGKALVDPDHNPVWTALISAEAADALVNFWRTAEGDGLVHDFTDPDLGTRFLGDLYQDLSDHAKKTYALLQTPVFVEEFILDQTLTPAVDEFGLEGLRLIDPACGSGHFLLGAFQRLDEAWAREQPGMGARERIEKVLSSVHGVDINPFAVAIARFRLTVIAMQAGGWRSLSEAPSFRLQVAVGDALLNAIGGRQTEIDVPRGVLDLYDTEDIDQHQDVLTLGTYHAVVANPPYITVKDASASASYRQLYTVCSGKYALSAPFAELLFRLAVSGAPGSPGGFVGQITSNSFMKREFGKVLVAKLLAGKDTRTPVDLTAVVDTSGAYIPGHGTPTVILLGRRRRPQHHSVRAVLGVRGEPGQPADPAQGLVWTEIVDRFSGAPSQGRFVTVADVNRERFSKHPWSLSGGNAGDVMRDLGRARTRSVQDVQLSIGFAAITGDDEVFVRRRRSGPTLRSQVSLRRFVEGERVRDYGIHGHDLAVFPYPVEQAMKAEEVFWPFRTTLRNGLAFGQTREDRDLWWGEYILPHGPRLTARRLITFAFVATHNHFVLDRGGKVFNRSAPVIMLPESASEQDHLDLLGVLNSSTACFWLKQVSHGKGNGGVNEGFRGDDWEEFFEFTGTKLSNFPLPRQLPGARGGLLDELATELASVSPAAVLADTAEDGSGPGLAVRVVEARARWHELRARMVFEQEELDWDVYRLYGLVEDELTYAGDIGRQLNLGERAFEVALARHVAAETEETAWFERHGSTPLTELPAHWSDDYRAVVQRRLDLIADEPQVALIERPENKRRWATPGWEALLEEALTATILDRLEQPSLWQDDQGPLIRSVAQLASALRHDEVLAELVTLLTGTAEHDLTAVLRSLIADEAVPYLAAHRYKESGIEKYRTWQEVWVLQREEDAGRRVAIDKPPTYAQADFRTTAAWRNRGKLDVPKEHFISYPGLTRAGDSTVLLGWAGWDHADQARALARETGEQQAQGAAASVLAPLVAGLAELEPWLRQWHADLQPGFPISPADAITGFVDALLSVLNTTRKDLETWRPPAAARGRRPRS